MRAEDMRRTGMCGIGRSDRMRARSGFPRGAVCRRGSTRPSRPSPRGEGNQRSSWVRGRAALSSRGRWRTRQRPARRPLKFLSESTLPTARAAGPLPTVMYMDGMGRHGVSGAICRRPTAVAKRRPPCHLVPSAVAPARGRHVVKKEMAAFAPLRQQASGEWPVAGWRDGVAQVRRFSATVTCRRR